MDYRIIFSLFLLVFVGLFGLINYYVWRRIGGLFGLKRNAWFYVGVAVSTLVFFAVRVLGSEGGLAQAAGVLAAIWVGTIFIAACVLVLFEIANRFVRLKPRRWGMIVLGVTLGLVVASLVCAAVVRVKEVELASEKIAEPVRIVQLSDVHLGAVRDKEFLERTAARVRDLDPDAVVITGDLIDGPGEYDPDILSPLDTMGVPVFFVTGNHEGYAGDTVFKLLAPTNITYLGDEAVDFAGIQLIGIDDRNNRQEVARTLHNISIDEERYAVLLYHRPSASAAIIASNATRPDLMLSGHTHAGQIFPFTLLVALVERPVRGLHDRDGMKVYVNVGTGTWGPPMRLGSTGEITVIDLVPAS